MGVCLSAEERESRQRSHEIDKQLEEDNKRLQQECKLLLLGIGWEEIPINSMIR
jgi:guanine nucleotide-binding protein G(i) subunit alpha